MQVSPGLRLNLRRCHILYNLKDALANLVAGVLILIHRPYKPGDHIEVAGKKGVVATIDLRYTELAVEGDRVLIPNQTAFNNTVVVRPKE